MGAGDILASVTQHAPARRSRVRRTSLVLATTAALVTIAGPAGADVPEGWAEPTEVSPLDYLGVLLGAPLLLAAVIALLVYLPALLRGERVAPGPRPVENQWLGGPRKGTSELAGPDREDSQAGGASARW